MMKTESEKVLVAMSGGVDSCAAAALLHEQGYSVVGVSMQVWDYRRNGGNSTRATCCAPADFEDARSVAQRCGFPYYVFDFEEEFSASVIDPFVNSYLNGYTPNPCVECNRKVKFKLLRERARKLGIEKVATGHYAQIRNKPDGTLGLYTAIDDAKDQSYFLFAMTQEELRSTLFPVGHMRKPMVREYLDSMGLTVASKKESQDICFVAGSVSEFIERHSRAKPLQGKFIRSGGAVLGEHSGIHNFTVGQRRGLGVSNAAPLYVLNLDSETNTVMLGEKHELEQETFVVGDVNWVSGRALTETIRVNAKLRYRHPGVECELTPIGPGQVRGRFLSEWTAISPGQAAVFYAADSEQMIEVLGGGRIEKDSAGVAGGARTTVADSSDLPELVRPEY